MKTTLALSGPCFQSAWLTPGKRETSVGPGVGRLLESVQVAGSEVGRGACVGADTIGVAVGASVLVGRRGVGVGLAAQAWQASSASPASAPIKSHNFRIVFYLPFTNKKPSPC